MWRGAGPPAEAGAGAQSLSARLEMNKLVTFTVGGERGGYTLAREGRKIPFSSAFLWTPNSISLRKC